MASSWPERIKSEGPNRSTPMLDYEYRPVGSFTTYYGQTNSSYNQLGTSKLVYCVSPKPMCKPQGWAYFDRVQRWSYILSRRTQWAKRLAGFPQLNRFQARKVTHSCDDEVYRWDYPYPGPRVILTGKLAANYFPAVQDQAPLGFPGWDDNHSNAAIIEAYSKVCDSSAEVGTMLGELRETLTYLRKPWASAVKLYTSFLKRPGVLSSLKHGTSFAANEWMAYRYGIRPMMSDIQKLMTLSAALMDSGFHRSGGASPRVQSVSSTDTQENLLGINFKWRNVTTVTTQAHCKVYWKYSPSVTNMSLLLDSLQLSPYDVPSVIWELVPLSFVVDWFANVGTWLKAARPKPNSSVLGNCVSLKTVTHVERFCVEATSSYTAYPCKSLARSRAHSITEVIDRNVSLPFPSLPPFNAKTLGIAKEIDSLILIGQRLPGRK